MRHKQTAYAAFGVSVGAWLSLLGVEIYMAVSGLTWPPSVHSYLLTGSATATISSVVMIGWAEIIDKIATSETAYRLGARRREMGDTPSGEHPRRRLRAVP